MAVYFVPLPGDNISIQQCNDGSVTITLDGSRTYEFAKPRDAYSFLRELYPPMSSSNEELERHINPRAALERKPGHD